MATKSIYKNIRINDRKLVIGFINALEHAKGKKSKNVELSKKCRELKGEQVKELFKNL